MIRQLTMPEYLALDALSSGIAHILLSESPQHARHAQQQRAESSSEADVGTAIHSLLLEGVDQIERIDAPDWRSKAAKEAREAARAAGRIPILAHKAELILHAVGAARHAVAVSEIGDVFAQGEPERTLLWEEDGVQLKARPDWLNGYWIIHVKTTSASAEPNSWIRNQLTNSGYDLAAVFYEHGAQALSLKRESLFLVVEQAPPHGCSLIGLAPAMRDLAERKFSLALALWRQCLQANSFPGFPRQICYAEPKPWQLAEAEERDLNAAYDALQEREGLQA